MNKKIIPYLLIVFLLLTNLIFGDEPTIQPPFQHINSIFGPRYLDGFNFHQGIDYRAPVGTSIKSLENGRVFAISTDANGNKFIDILNSDNIRIFRYVHIFDDSFPAVSNIIGYDHVELRPAETGAWAIIFYSTKTSASKALCKDNGARVLDADGNYILDQNGASIHTTNTVVANDVIAPVGTSGGVDEHLHLTLLDGSNLNNIGEYDNPLLYVQRGEQGESDFTQQLIDKNEVNRVSGQWTINLNDNDSKYLRARVTFNKGLDLDKILFFVDQVDSSHQIKLESTGSYSFCFGGRKNENYLKTKTESDGTNTGVIVFPGTDNQGIEGLLDVVVVGWDTNENLNENTKPSNLTAGDHNLIIRTTDVNCENPYETGSGTHHFDSNYTFKIIPKDYILFHGSAGFINVKLGDEQQTPSEEPTESEVSSTPTPTPSPTETVIINTPTPSILITEVPVDKYLKGVLYALTKDADFSNPEYLEGFKALAVSAYTLLLHEVEYNGGNYDILVNGYSSNQGYFLPYQDFGDSTVLFGTKALIDQAVNAVLQPIGTGIDKKYYIKAFWFDQILSNKNDFITTRAFDNATIPNLLTLYFSYAQGKSAQNSLIQASINEIGLAYTYLRETKVDEADVDVPTTLQNGTKAGMSAWGAMFLSAHAFKVDNILKDFYHWAPVYLKKVIITQDGKNVYTMSRGKIYNQNGSLMRKVSVTSTGLNSSSVATAYMYFSDNISPITSMVTLKVKDSDPIKSALLPSIISIDPNVDNDTTAYPGILSGTMTALQYNTLLEGSDANSSKTVVLAVSCNDKYNYTFNDQTPDTPAFTNTSGESTGYESSILGSDETNMFSLMKVADANPASQGTKYNVNPTLVTANASVSNSFNLQIPAPDLHVNWKDLFSKLNINFGKFDLSAALIHLNINFDCLSADDKVKLQSINLQSADYCTLHADDDLKTFMTNELHINADCLSLPNLKLNNLFSFPVLTLPNLNISLPRLDLSGLKWGYDLSKSGILLFPDKLQGPEVWNTIRGLFKFSLNFRGISAPTLPQINLHTGNNGISGMADELGGSGNTICNPLTGTATNIMGQASQLFTNAKVAGSGTGSNVIIDYITNTVNGMGNTTTADFVDSISSVVIAGGFLSAGGIDTNSIKTVMECQKIAKDVGAGMAILGAIQMSTDPGMGQYLLQGAIGYVKTWAEGEIKTMVFKEISKVITDTMMNNNALIDTLGAKLPRGTSFPGYSSGHFDYDKIRQFCQPDDVKDWLGCKDSVVPEWDLKKLDWNNVLDIATSVADYIDKYDKTKDDLATGGAWLENFATRDMSTIISNLQKIKSLTVKASGGSSSGSLTVDEGMMKTLGEVLKLLKFVPEPISSGVTNIGPIIVSIFCTKDGNLYNTVKNQLGNDNPQMKAITSAISEKGTALMKEMKVGDFPDLSNILPFPLPFKFDFLPFIGDLINQVMSSMSFGQGEEGDAGGMLEDLDIAGSIGVYYPYRAEAQNPLSSYDGWIRGVTTDNSIIHIEGWSQDYLPQFIQMYAQADNGPVVTTVLNIDTTLMTSADGKSGQADWVLDVPLPHAGANTVKIWSMNAGGHRVDMQFTAYLVGTSFPQNNARAVPISSFIWRAYDSWIGGIGEHVVKQDGGIINFISAKPGDRALSDVFNASDYIGKEVRIFYPDSTTNPDLEMVDAQGNSIISNIPANGQFRFRLKNKYTGKSFITVMGSADATKFKEVRLEYSPGWVNRGDPADSNFATNGGITISNGPYQGPLFQVMTSWDVWSKRLYGPYTIRTTISDDNEGYFYVSGTAEMDRAHFTIGTPIDVSNTAATIVTDPYIKCQLQVEKNTVKQTEFVNIYSENSDLVTPLLSNKYETLTPKYGIYPALTSDRLFVGNQMTMTIRYTRDDLFISNFNEIFGLTDTTAADYTTQVEKAEGIIEANLGIYREISSIDSSGNSYTAREHIYTYHSPGSYSVYAHLDEANGKYFVMPADNAPILRYPPTASPFIFNPEEESKGRTCTAIYFSPMATTSKYVFADIKIMDYQNTRVVRDLYDGIENKQQIELKYSGKYGDIDEYNGIKYNFYNFDETKDYRSILPAPLNGILWDGKGTRLDGTGGYVEDGVYRAIITLMDSFGNSSTGSCVVVKGRIVPQITQIGGIAAVDGMSLNAQNWADGQASIMGTATGAEAFRGYMVGYRPSNYTSDTGSIDDDEGYTYINLPKQSTAGAVTTTAYNVQIIDGTLANLDVSSLINGNYDLRLFILGQLDGGSIQVLDRATIKNIHVQTQPGINDVKADPNPFASVVTLTANVYTPDYSPVTFTVFDSSGNTLAEINGVNVQGLKYQAVWDATTQPDGYYTVSVTAGTFGKAILARKYTSLNNITANISSPLNGASVISDILVNGSADVEDSAGQTIPVKMQYYEIYDQVNGGEWQLAERNMDTVTNDWLATIPINSLKGDNLNIKLFVIDTAGNSKTTEVDGMNIQFNATLSVSPSTYVRGIGTNIAIDYNINKDVDAIYLIGGTQGSVPVNFYNFVLSTDDITVGSHRIYWNGVDYQGNNISTGSIPVKLMCYKGNSLILQRTVYFNSCNPSQMTDMPGVTLDAYGLPKPFFDYIAVGSGKYDRPIPVSYTVTSYANENYSSHPIKKEIAHSYDQGCTCTIFGGECDVAYNYWPGPGTYDTNTIPFNMSLTKTVDNVIFDNRTILHVDYAQYSPNNDNNRGILWVNGNENKANDLTWTLNQNDQIRVEARARQDCNSGHTADTWSNFYHLDFNDSPIYVSATGKFDDQDILYQHRAVAKPFVMLIPPVHILDYPEEPQHGVISNSYFCGNGRNDGSEGNYVHPLVNFSFSGVTATVTGFGVNILPRGEHYFAVTNTPYDLGSMRSANEKNKGIHSGTINIQYKGDVNFNITAGLTAVMTIHHTIVSLGNWARIFKTYDDTYETYNYTTSTVVTANNIKFNQTMVLPRQTISLNDQVLSTEDQIFARDYANQQMDTEDLYRVTNVAYSNYSAVVDSNSNSLVSIDISDYSGIVNTAAIDCGVTIAVQDLTENWAFSQPKVVRDNFVIFQPQAVDSSRQVNIFQTLNNTFGNSINPFPNQNEFAQITFTAGVVAGPDSVPHSSAWTINGAYYPDSTEIHDDVILAKGTTITGMSNGNTISFNSVSGTSTDGFEAGKSYDEYDIDKIQLKLKDPSPVPYESRTYIKISGTVDVSNLTYYALSYKKADPAENDVYHQFKYSTMTAQNVLGYLPVKDKIGRYSILLSVVINDNGDTKAYQTEKIVDVGHNIDPLNGGTATDAYEQAFLFFPPGALRQDKLITITPLKRNELPILQSSLIPAALIYSFQAVNLGASTAGHLRKDDFVMDSYGNIPKPAVLTLTYDPRQLGSYDESTLSLYKLDIPDNSTQEQLELIPSFVDKVNHVITTELTSFSTVQLIPNTDSPTFEFNALPDPAGIGSVVDIYIKSTKTLSQNLIGSLTLPDLNVTYQNGRTVPLTFVQQSKPYLNGTSQVSSVCPGSNFDSYQLVLGNLYNNGINPTLPCSGVPKSTLSGTPIIFSYPGTNLPNRTYYINRSGVYTDDSDVNNITSQFWISLIDQPGNTINEKNISEIVNGTTHWSCNNPDSNTQVSGSINTNCTSMLTLIKTTPGQKLAFPPVGWWDGKKIVIGSNTYYLTNVQINGNEMSGAQVNASLSDLSQNPIPITDSMGNTTWTMYAPVSEYKAEFNVAQNVPTNVSGQVEVDFSGIDFVGNTGSGKGYFTIDTGAGAVSIKTDKDSVKSGDTLLVSAKSSINGQMPSIGLYKYPSWVTLTVDANNFSDVVITGTDIKTGERTYLYTVQSPELSNYEGLIAAVAGVTVNAQNVYASKTVTVDTKAPLISLNVLNHLPLGIGIANLNITSDEPLSGSPQVKVSALTADGWQALFPPVTDTYNNFNAPLDIKATYLYSSITVEVLGVDLAGNPGNATTIIPIDTRAPDQLKGLNGSRQSLPGGINTYYANMLTWDSLTPTVNDLAGYVLYKDNILLTANAVTTNAYVDILSGQGFDFDSGKSHIYYVAGIDTSGNIGQGSYLTILPDSNAPVTILDIIGNSFNANTGIIYLSSSSLLRLTATDMAANNEDSSGINRTSYNFNYSDPMLFNNYVAPFACMNANTMTALYYRSVDKNGNSETVKYNALCLDTNIPETTLQVIQPYYVDSGTVSALNVTLPAGIENWDRASIVAALTTSASSVFTQSMVDSLLSTTITSDDEIRGYLALITSTASSNNDSVSNTTISQGSGMLYINSNYSQLSITANDTFDGYGSGIKNIYFKIDGGLTQTFCSDILAATPFSVTYLAEGMHTIETIGVDNVGNSGKFLGFGSNLKYFMVDNSAPSTSAHLLYGSHSVTISASSSSVTVTAISCQFSLTAADNGAVPCGVNKTFYSINGSSFNEYTTPVTLSPGLYSISYYSIDKVSNTESIKMLNMAVIIPIKLEYKSGDTNNGSNAPHPMFKLDNISTLSLDLSKIEIKYWYKYDGPSDTEIGIIDYAGKMVAGTDVTSHTHASIINGTYGSSQDRYLSATFDSEAGYLQPADYMYINTRYNKIGWGAYDQSNDWSYLAVVNYQEWDKVTVYYDGVLIWGLEPGQTQPTATPTVVLSATMTPDVTPTLTSTITMTTTITPTATQTATSTPITSPTPTSIILFEYKTGDGSNTTNSPHPMFMVQNVNSSPIDLSLLEIKYWYSFEGGSEQTEISTVDYSGKMVAGTNIVGNTHLSTNRAKNCSGPIRYLDVTFDSSAGTLLSQDYIYVNTRFNKSDWSPYDQSNDWSFANYSNYQVWDKVSVYYYGVLIWGQEPCSNQPQPSPTDIDSATITPEVTPTTTLTITPTSTNTATSTTEQTATPTAVITTINSATVLLEYKSGDSNINTNSPHPMFMLENTDTNPLDLSKIEIKYWYSYEGSQQQELSVLDYSGKMVAGTLLSNNTHLVINNVNYCSGQMRYLDVTFDSGAGTLLSNDYIYVNTRFNKLNWDPYDQSNDWSFANYSNYQVWNNVTVYYNGSLIWGTEPTILTAICSATNTVTPTITETITATVTPTVTQTGTTTATETITTTSTDTITSTVTETSTVTSTGTITPSSTETITPTVTGTVTTTSTATITGTSTATITPTQTNSITPTSTYTSSSTFTKTVTATVTGSSTPTPTQTDTSTATKTSSPSSTVTPSITVTSTNTTTKTLTATLSATRSITQTPTNSFTRTNTLTITQTSTITPTFTQAPANITLKYKCADTNVNSNSPHPQFRLYNNSSSSLALSRVEIRYWYKFEGTNQSEQAAVDTGLIMPSGTHIESYINKTFVTGSFGNQDRYLKITFTASAGSLNTNDYVEIQSRFNKSDWSNYDQSNDWSFINYNDFTNWNNVTVYIDGVLTWGTSPGSGVLSVNSKVTPTPTQVEELSESNTYNYPNPFSGETTIRFSLARAEDVNIYIYDINDNLVWKNSKFNGKVGINTITWSGLNDRGEEVANGVYLLEVSIQKKTVKKKIVLIN